MTAEKGTGTSQNTNSVVWKCLRTKCLRKAAWGSPVGRGADTRRGPVHLPSCVVTPTVRHTEPACVSGACTWGRQVQSSCTVLPEKGDVFLKNCEHAAKENKSEEEGNQFVTPSSLVRNVRDHQTKRFLTSLIRNFLLSFLLFFFVSQKTWARYSFSILGADF